MRSSIKPINHLTFLEMLQKDEIEKSCCASNKNEKFAQ